MKYSKNNIVKGKPKHNISIIWYLKSKFYASFFVMALQWTTASVCCKKEHEIACLKHGVRLWPYFSTMTAA